MGRPGGKLTQKQAAFVTAKVAGLSNTDAAKAAGYSTAGAAVQANALMKLPHVKAAIRRGDKAAHLPVPSPERALSGKRGGDWDGDGDGEQAGAPKLKPTYATPLDFMLDTMNNPRMADSVRMEAAKQALPYVHGRIEPRGKKEGQRERAAQIAGGSDNGKPKSSRAPMQPPSRPN